MFALNNAILSRRSRIVATGPDALLSKVGSNECVDQVISEVHPEGIASFTCEDANPKPMKEVVEDSTNITTTTSSSNKTEVASAINGTEAINGLLNETKDNNSETYQEFMYKCGREVEENFWIAPLEFRMAYGEAKIDHFKNDLNYFPLYNFTLKERAVECTESFTLSTSINLNVFESGPNLTTLNFTPNGYLTYIYSSGDLIDEIYFSRERFCVAK